MTPASHITVCVCTYRRPAMLRELFYALENQDTGGSFSLSVVVVDNDRNRSAEDTVKEYSSGSSLEIVYDCEPVQNISLARNRAVGLAGEGYLAFVDDDEIPQADWLLRMWEVMQDRSASAVLGPVNPRFVQDPPSWIIRGELFERPSHITGQLLHWNETRTGNVLVRSDVLGPEEDWFDPAFGRTGGEDKEFFRRVIENGKKVVWCQEAPVYETVTPDRFRRWYFLRYALMRGGGMRKSPDYGAGLVLKSVAAFTVYTLGLPFFLLMGQAVFMNYLIKSFNHAGSILGAMGIVVVRERDEFGG